MNKEIKKVWILDVNDSDEEYELGEPYYFRFVYLTEQEYEKAKELVLDFDVWYYNEATDDERDSIDYSVELYERLKKENLLGIDFQFVSLEVR